MKPIPIRCPRNPRGTLCHLAWLLGCNRFAFEKYKNRQFEKSLAQVCGAVSKAEEEELCSKQLELVIGKLSHPGVTASTMADCMVCDNLHFIALVKILSDNFSGADRPHSSFGL